MHTKTANGFECQVCSFKTSFKYSLKRHIEKQHGGNSQSSQEENRIEIEIAPVVESLETFRSHSIAQMLEKVGLSNLSIRFDEQGVDLDMLIGLNNDDMKECMKEVGINRFGDRHKILQQIQIEKRKNVSTEIIETIDTPDQSIIQESGESIENDCVGDLLDGTEEENEEANENESFDDQTNDNSIVECPLCRDSSQHCCRICGKPVCNLFCSVPDPRSDNESHRVHKHGDFRCISQQFECPSCGKTFAKPSELQEHMLNHTQESSLTLLSQAGSEFERLLMEEGNVSQSVTETLEELGIVQLPIVGKRIRQNFDDIVINEDGKIFIEDDDDGDFSFSETYEKRKKRKLGKEKSVISKKMRKDQEDNGLRCEICGNTFSRKDSLARHRRNQH